ncbi:hypothetical protein JAAARDRAFT_169132 [Jaapia argillacea MUCL 33604]|uniref:Chromatin remodeling factor mit1 n=1 Tax=Jaapia argillacea MUCL 33604 TaxID=933084 RepID=A0A067QB55_9AGAM|nr:hypothetical protein JAAARDRAFT_169132 [Jaapia argillacea MUCL 33604]
MSVSSSSDVANLFTPTKPKHSNGVVLETTLVPQTPEPPQKGPSRFLFVSLPVLSASEKELYKTGKELGFEVDPEDEDDLERLQEIKGEYDDGHVLYYFACRRDGICRKYTKRQIQATRRELIYNYDLAKRTGTLSPFDPSAHYVHPDSRVRIVININKSRPTARGGPSTRSKPVTRRTRAQSKPDKHEETVPATDEEDELGMGASDEDYHMEEGTPIPTRKSARTGAVGANKRSIRVLPFSPKKTRSKGFIVHDSDEEDSDVEEQQPSRRSTRNRKSAKANLADDDYVEDEIYELDSEDEISLKRVQIPKNSKKRTNVYGKAARPAYGHIRVIADLDYDPYPDEDNEALRAHRDTCEKCHSAPAHLLEAQKKKGKGKRKQSVDEDEESEDDISKFGGWVRCLKCPVTAHWGCLASTQRDEILRAARDRDRVDLQEKQAAKAALDGATDGDTQPKDIVVPKRDGLTPYQTTEFICGSCMKGGICMGCMAVVLEPEAPKVPAEPQATNSGEGNGGDVEMKDAPISSTAPLEDSTVGLPRELLFRCITCKRLAHYEHLPVPSGQDASDFQDAVSLAEYYQSTNQWKCADCSSFTYAIDKVLAWRPYPPNAVEPPLPPGEIPNYRSPLPREYLVKWVDRSYRRTQWVPHMWLLSAYSSRLRNFLSVGSKIALLEEPVTEEPDADVEMTEKGDAEKEIGERIPFTGGDDSSKDDLARETPEPSLPTTAISDAERRIPLQWKTVDRVLDVLLWFPQKRLGTGRKGKQKQPQRRTRRVQSDEEDELDEAVEAERTAAFEEGEQPSADLTETVDEWQDRTGEILTLDHLDELVDEVVWAFIKWDDLGYDESTWDSPPRRGQRGYAAFRAAFERFIAARQVVVPAKSKAEYAKFDKRVEDGYRKFALRSGAQPSLGQNKQLALMPFQIDGVNWLCDNWWNLQHCILADEMGLGKTVQIASFIGTIVDKWAAFPALVVVPNSTITNWVREFARWAPRLRVVPFYGESKAREVIKRFELSHSRKDAKSTGAKFHVLVTTYESLINQKDFTPIFKSVPRWEVLVVDEGQRLKNDASLLFKRLNELNTIHRIIMTGTPLNNNIRELFNLMNFLDPKEWRDLEALEKEYEVLTEDLVKDLHNRLRPYFLRRIKTEVLPLPPKNEVIVPVSMTPLQKEVYRSILSQNLNVLKRLTQPSSSISASVSKSNMNNMLMQLRKCLQHPYLVSEDIEPRGLPAQETHHKLIDGSAKLRLLKGLLPKLKARGHRVLLFSQFVIALNIVEDYLIGEGIKYLRLDGNTKQSDRQKGMDEFNKPDSDVFIYLLTTRAGGVGINLWSADTVIIFDPDFNPHQDLQAIARAHRFGQKKTCLVFKLMVKESAEERIMQTGKKKLVLDHLIVQKMDDEDGTVEDVQSILTFGAQALFEEGGDQSSRDITYTDHDLDKLIEKTETEGDQSEADKAGANSGGGLFAFAKIWSADKDTLEELEEVPVDQGDSWAQTLERITAEKERVVAQEVTGRGARRKAAPAFAQQTLPPELEDSPDKNKDKRKKKGRRSKSRTSDDDDDDDYRVHLGSGAASIGANSDGESSDTTASLMKDDLKGLSRGPGKKHAVGLSVPFDSLAMSDDEPTSRYRVAGGGAPLSPIHANGNGRRPRLEDDADFCGLCGSVHGPGFCYMTESSENLAEYRQMLLVHADDEPIEDRRAAIEAIDETLHKRGCLHLIHGQPLHLIGVPLRQSDPTRTNKSHHKKHAAGEASRKAQTNGNAVAGPSSKRPSEEPSHGGANKKAKTSGGACVICGRTPSHLIKDCPIVALGPKSVAMEITRLDQDPKHSSTVAILRKILGRQKKKELTDLSSDGPTMVMDG